VSGILKDRAIILKTFDFKESSSVIVALTRKHGKMRFIAKGARRRNSPFAGRLGTGSIAEIVFQYRDQRELQVLRELDGAAPFPTGEEDLERLCIFQAGLEIADRSVVERDGDEQAFDLVEVFIRILPVAADPWFLFFALEARLLCVLGIFPSLESCYLCGRPAGGKELSIDPAGGGVTCDDCEGKGTLHLSADSLAVLERLTSCEPVELARMRMRSEERREIGRVLHHLFLNHVDGYTLPNALRLLKGGSNA
jgi:DNA repair protein RecO (recombination protein O)